MELEARKIAEIIGADVNGNPDKHIITSLLTDSRDLTYPDSTLFFALRTDVNDGHRYIPSLYSGGVRHFVVNKDGDFNEDAFPNAIFMKVDNTLDSLQKLGEYLRSEICRPVIGITGSRGKTIIKELLYKSLQTYYNVVRSPRSYNSQTGVPLSIWQIEDNTEIAIFEAGISQPGEMIRLQKIIRPTVGIFTSLTDEHQEGFETLENKAAEKALLFTDCEKVIIPADEENVDIIRKEIKKAAPHAEITEVEGGYKAMAEAAIRAIDVKKYDKECLKNESEKISSRINLTETLKNCIIVTDNFTNDMQSVHLALNATVRHLTPGRRLTFILLGMPREYDSESLLRLLKAKGVERFIGVGVDIECRGIRCEYSPGPEEFMRKYTISDFENEVILLKGESGSGAEEIKALLEAPRHETIMEVDLGSINRNFNFFRSKLRPETGIVAMVKASGYGIGALELAKTLQNQGASYLAVAVVDEGAELRREGIAMPIIVMNPLGTNHKALFDNHLEPSIFSIRELELLLESAIKYDITDYPVHIKLDTGMHRLGFLEDELDELSEALVRQNNIKVKSIFSHLATADCPDQNEYTRLQLSNFARMSDRLLNSLPYHAMRHILNTAGILRYPEYQYDMVRLGIGLYGVSPIDGYKLSTVARLFSTIISIKEWNVGTTIGYGRKGKVEKPSVIATVPIGYADGLNRHLSNGGAFVLVNGHKCPIIGNICMDQCMVDVTGAGAKIGDKVEIFGENAPIERLSDALDTIPYEVLTSVSPRVKRIYFRE